MMSSTLGAPLGGTTRGGHQGVESLASSLMTPPNFGGGGGSCLPSIEVVALGAPSVPVTCCAPAREEAVSPRTARSAAITRSLLLSHIMNSLLSSALKIIPQKPWEASSVGEIAQNN